MFSLTLFALAAAVLPLAAIQSPAGSRESPFMCNLNALTPGERTEHQQLTARLAGAVRTTREVADGYAFDVDSTQFSLVDLARWSEFERRCCPFFDFQLDARRENGPMTLRLTGREGVKEFIRVEFPHVVRGTEGR